MIYLDCVEVIVEKNMQNMVCIKECKELFG